MSSSELTIGDIVPFIELAKSNVLGVNITDFGVFFDKIEEILRASNQWTDELAGQLKIAEDQLTANPDLFQIGKANFIESVDALLEKYPPETPLSEIPEFGGTGSLPDGDGSTPPIYEGHDGIQIAVLNALRDGVIVDYDPETKVIKLEGAGVEITTFTDVARLQFEDGTLAFDSEGNAGQAYRLYQAAFDRDPDIEGLGYWIKHLDASKSDLNAIADSFLHSPEFINTYGTPETVGNAAFVGLLYTHTLGRDYDQSGFNYWVDKLDTAQTNRGDLLAFFSESNENVARVADEIDQGIWFV